MTPSAALAFSFLLPLVLPRLDTHAESVHGGVTFDLGADCRGGLFGTHDDVVDLSVWRTGRDASLHGPVGQTLRKGQLIVACGRFFRVLAIEGHGFSFDPTAVPSPAEASFRSDSLVIPVGGNARMGALGFKLRSIALRAGQPVADLALEITDHSGASRAGPQTTLLAAPGDVLGTSQRHRVLSVVAPDDARGIPGWLEVDTQMGR